MQASTVINHLRQALQSTATCAQATGHRSSAATACHIPYQLRHETGPALPQMLAGFRAAWGAQHWTGGEDGSLCST